MSESERFDECLRKAALARTALAATASWRKLRRLHLNQEIDFWLHEATFEARKIVRSKSPF
jgi:hypothetical protein